jgi:hypothetical protein
VIETGRVFRTRFSGTVVVWKNLESAFGRLAGVVKRQIIEA